MSAVRALLAAASVAGLVFAAATPALAATNLITNGDFETVGAMPTDLVGWTVTGTVARADGPTYGPCCGATGGTAGNHFATFGWANLSGLDAISQSFVLTLNKIYTLSFDAGALGGGSNVLVASADGAAPVAYTVNADNNLSTTFSPHSFSFLGTGVTQTVTFSVTTGPDNTDAILDNVSLTSVPEPATWAMMLMGFGGLGAMLRRQRCGDLAAA